MPSVGGDTGLCTYYPSIAECSQCSQLWPDCGDFLSFYEHVGRIAVESERDASRLCDLKGSDDGALPDSPLRAPLRTGGPPTSPTVIGPVSDADGAEFGSRLASSAPANVWATHSSGCEGISPTDAQLVKHNVSLTKRNF
eukprot:m.363916 g.363916  ORF g.363916 m.363916 type:complete len:140 (+) comp16654_c0_seq41:4554-4973(+)